MPMVTSQAIDNDKIATSNAQSQSSTGISESIFSVNSMSVATVSIALPDSVGDTGTNDLVLWVEVGRTKLLLADKEILQSPGILLTDKHINFAQTLFKK